MKKIILIVAVSFGGTHLFAQGKCAFTTPNAKVRHDQYSKSSKADIDKSKKDMDEQMAEFDKKKYQSTVKNTKATATQKQRKTAQRFD